MSKFKIGDRVRCSPSSNTYEILAIAGGQCWLFDPNDGKRWTYELDQLLPANPDGLVVEIECIANYGGDLGVVKVKGITLNRLNGKFRLVPVE